MVLEEAGLVTRRIEGRVQSAAGSRSRWSAREGSIGSAKCSLGPAALSHGGSSKTEDGVLLRNKNAVIYGGGGAIGGAADTAAVDALDQTAVDRHADAVAASAGRIDVARWWTE